MQPFLPTLVVALITTLLITALPAAAASDAPPIDRYGPLTPLANCERPGGARGERLDRRPPALDPIVPLGNDSYGKDCLSGRIRAKLISSSDQMEAMDMERSILIRLSLAAPILGFVYYRLLVLLIGWTFTVGRPAWWIGIFPSRHLAAVMWLVLLHTTAVVFAATPIAIAVVAIARKRPVLVGVIVGVVATAIAISPYFERTDLWRLVWDSQPIFFVTDQIKLIVAVPLVAWIILNVVSRRAFSSSASR